MKSLINGGASVNFIKKDSKSLITKIIRVSEGYNS